MKFPSSSEMAKKCGQNMSKQQVTTNSNTAQQAGVLYKPHPVVWLLCKEATK